MRLIGTMLASVAVLTIIGASVVHTLRGRLDDRPVYTIGQVAAGLKAQPTAWIGRVVYLRHVTYVQVGGTCQDGQLAGYQFYLRDIAADQPRLLIIDVQIDPQLGRLQKLPIIGGFFPAWSIVETGRYPVLVQEHGVVALLESPSEFDDPYMVSDPC